MDANEIDTLLQHVRAWPEDDQKELVDVARDIEARRKGIYRASEVSGKRDAIHNSLILWRGRAAKVAVVDMAFRFFRACRL
jgi:hypothetical protein